jgi:hypothetical protein
MRRKGVRRALNRVAFFGSWLGGAGANSALPKTTWVTFSCSNRPFFLRQWVSTKGSARAFFWRWFFKSPGDFSGDVFGVENTKTRGSSSEMPQTGSPLAKDKLALGLGLGKHGIAIAGAKQLCNSTFKELPHSTVAMSVAVIQGRPPSPSSSLGVELRQHQVKIPTPE